MTLGFFKIGDVIIQKKNQQVKWTILKKENGMVYLQRKGGHFNGMISVFGENSNDFEPAGRTEQRIKREEKIKERRNKEATFKKQQISKKLLPK